MTPRYNGIYFLRSVLADAGWFDRNATHGAACKPAPFMGWYLALWGIFTGFMFIGSLCYPTAKQVVFGSLTILFALLAARDFTGSELIGTIAGFEGIFCGASAIYFAMAQVLNNEYGRVVLPIGEKRVQPVKAQELAA